MTRIAIYSNELETKQIHADEPANEFERYSRLLGSHMPDTEFVMFDVVRGQFPIDLSQFDGAIIGGSTAMVSDDREWIPQLVDHIRLLDSVGMKIWGTCFGHQILAHVFGGEVGVRTPTVGAPVVEVLSPQDWMHPYLPSLRIYAGNLQQVLKLGPDMRRLAIARGNANAMFAVRDTIVGFQFHPELSMQFMENYADKCLREGAIDIHLHKDAKAELHEATDHDLVAKWMAHFFLN